MQIQGNPNTFYEQPVNAGVIKPEGSALQRFHYDYNPEEGTQLRWGNSLMTVTGFTAAGAAGMNCISSYLERLGNQSGSIFERSVNMIAENPVVAGAVAGGACGILFVSSIRGEGLKPRTQEGVRFIMNGLIHKVEKGSQNVEQFKKAIDINRELLSKKKASMEQEKEVNERAESVRYAKAMQLYQLKAGLIAGELQGYLDGLFERLNDPERCPTYEETVSGRRVGGTFELGHVVSGFFHDRNYSWSAQNSLKKELIPVLTEKELNKVEAIFARFPSKPVYWPKVGPLQAEYNRLQSINKSTVREMAEMQNGLSSLLKRYPILQPDTDNKVTPPSFEVFRTYLPD